MSERFSPQQHQLLDALLTGPFMTARQLAWRLRKNEQAIQRLLWQLHRGHLIRRYSFVPDGEQTAQWLYTLTTQGVNQLARHKKLSQRIFQQERSYSISRLRWLVCVLDRVYHTREVLRVIEEQSDAWWVSVWNSETEIRYEHNDGWRWLSFQCSAILKNNEQCWVPLIIEWDSGDLPIEAEHDRWKNFLVAQGDAIFDYSTAYHFPVLIYVARNRNRLTQFVELINQIRTERYGLSQPVGYLTWQDNLFPIRLRKSDESLSSANDEAIWFATEHGRWVTHALADCNGNTGNS